MMNQNPVMVFYIARGIVSMKEITGDIFKVTDVDGVPVVGICFTSNPGVRKDGRAIMGAGVAKAFRDKFNDLDLEYGKILVGSRVNLTTDFGARKLDGRDVRIIAFPTKNNWKYNSTIELITLSAMRLKTMIETDKVLSSGIVLLPRPGCSNGGLQWDEVRKVIKPILPKNVVIITQDHTWKREHS